MKWTSVFEFCVTIAAWGQAAGGRRLATGDSRLATAKTSACVLGASGIPSFSALSAAGRLPPAACRGTFDPFLAPLPLNLRAMAGYPPERAIPARCRRRSL